MQTVRRVIDGDTLLLNSGEKVRLIGINTPELARKRHPAETYARRAKARLKALVAASGSKLYLQYGRESRDRYHRSLAHIYNKSGRNLTEQLLREGFGYATVFPPNLRNIDCYQQAEKRARESKVGLWRNRQPISAVDLPPNAGGFYLLQGLIKRVGKSRRSLWLNLEGGVALRIDWQDMHSFPGLQVDALEGRRLEARGWIYRRKGERRIQLRHQAAVRWLP
ncbi:MAG: thermonuclease family protein [Candidatus Polarisedimenticolaceae bacterium]|nr:thermonuclease family protein [Candidatus Polarisedimenticolaceae bacterium]